MPLGTGAPFLEAYDLYDVEEYGTDRVGGFRVDVLEAPPERGVAVAVGPEGNGS